jgi:hypothetical protein
VLSLVREMQAYHVSHAIIVKKVVTYLFDGTESAGGDRILRKQFSAFGLPHVLKVAFTIYNRLYNRVCQTGLAQPVVYCKQT